MAKISWKEAEPQRGWPQIQRDQWPDDDEYLVLRQVKARLIQDGPKKKWCNCTANCSHGSMAGWDAEYINSCKLGPQRVAAVSRANNKYGFVSMLYTWGMDVINGQFQHVGSTILMRWDGVPLKAAEPQIIRREPEWQKPPEPFSQKIGAADARITVSGGGIASKFTRS